MKKTYIIPQMEAVLTEQHLPIANSPLQFGDEVSDTEGDVKAQGDWDIFSYEED